MIQYRKLEKSEISANLFRGFIRRQVVTDCWRKEKNRWTIKRAPFVDDWGKDEYEVLTACLKHTAETGGLVCGAFRNGLLKGFASVESGFLGSRSQYMDLSSIHVSQDMRGTGIGKELFALAKRFAREHHAEKLYISAHSAVETQAFYRAMGCVEAEEPDPAHMEKEPFDCQLECLL